MTSLLIASALLAGAVSLPTPEPVSMTKPRVAMYATAVTDIATTMAVLSTGGREANKIIGPSPSLKKLVVIKAGAIAVIEATAYLLRKAGKHDEARLNYWIVAVMWGLISVWNTTQIHFTF